MKKDYLNKNRALTRLRESEKTLKKKHQNKLLLIVWSWAILYNLSFYIVKV